MANLCEIPVDSRLFTAPVELSGLKYVSEPP